MLQEGKTSKYMTTVKSEHSDCQPEKGSVTQRLLYSILYSRPPHPILPPHDHVCKRQVRTAAPSPKNSERGQEGERICSCVKDFTGPND